MATCIPIGVYIPAVSSATRAYSWWPLGVLIGYWRARRAAITAANAAHPAVVTTALTTACGIGPAGCTCTTTSLGPFQLISRTGFFSGNVTAVIITLISPTFTCNTVPAGAIGFASGAESGTPGESEEAAESA